MDVLEEASVGLVTQIVQEQYFDINYYINALAKMQKK